MTVIDIINNVLAGGLLGVLGQGIRVAVGLKKLNDDNQTKPDSQKEPFSASRLILSLFIGFTAGAIGIFVKGNNNNNYTTESIMTIIAVGYSGADFIEGLFNTYISGVRPSTATQPSPAAPLSQTPIANGGAAASAAAAAPALVPLTVPDESQSTPSQVLG